MLLASNDEEYYEFQAVDWEEYHQVLGGTEKYCILIIGRCTDGKDICVKVTDFAPSFCFSVPREIDNFEGVEKFMGALKRKVSWHTRNSPRYDKDLSECLLSYEYLRNKKKQFYYFQHNEKVNVVECKFTSHNAMLAYSFAAKYGVRMGKNNVVPGNIYGSNLSSILKIIHKKDLQSAGWIRIPKDKARNVKGLSRCDISIRANWKHLESSFSQDRFAPLKVISYDIETVSPSGNFPKPDVPKDEVIIIGFTTNILGSAEIVDRVSLALGECDDVPGTRLIKYKTEREFLRGIVDTINELRPDIMTGHNIFNFDDNYVYNRMLMQDELEAKKLGVDVEDLPRSFAQSCLMNLGKVRNKYLIRKEGLTYPLTKFSPLKLNTSALGDNDLTMFRIPGIIEIDTMSVIKVCHKLSSYTLDSVLATFITERMIDPRIVKVRGKNAIVKFNTTLLKGLEEKSYIQIMKDRKYYQFAHEDAKYQVKKIKEVGPKDFEISIQMPKADFHELMEEVKKNKRITLKWAFAKDEMSFNDMFDYYCKGDAKGMATSVKYCVQDCQLVNLLCENLQMVVNNMSMASVCKVPFSYIFYRGQGIKTYSLVSYYCDRAGILVPVLPKSEKVRYEGAQVFEPIPGVYEYPIDVLDFNSLYPSSMMENNFSHEMLVTKKKYMNLPGYTYHKVSYQIQDENGVGVVKDGKPVMETCVFAQKIATKEVIQATVGEELAAAKAKRDADLAANPDNQDAILTSYAKTKANIMKPHFNKVDGKWCEYGIICKILAQLLASRSKAKYMMNTAKDPFTHSIFNSLQLAYKVVANNTYGQTGASTSSIYLPQIAASTTAIGRERLHIAKRVVEEKFPGARIVYGDTDSVFIDFNIRGPDGKRLTGQEALDASQAAGYQACKYINAEIASPQNIEREKTMYPLILISKKKYVGVLYEDVAEKGKVTAMGMVLKRRDNAPVVKMVISELIDSILIDKSKEKAMTSICHVLDDIARGNSPLKHFVITKNLKTDASYKNPSSIAHWVLAQKIGKRDPGNKPRPNDRMEFAVVVVPPSERVVYDKKGARKKPSLGSMLETPTFIAENKIPVNYAWYLEKQIQNPLFQILELMISPNEIKKMYDQFVATAVAKTYGKGIVNDLFVNNSIYIPKVYGTKEKVKPKYSAKSLATLW